MVAMGERETMVNIHTDILLSYVYILLLAIPMFEIIKRLSV